MRRRSGITLIEVLVAIFIMAIGLLAILTLFPLGALRMGESLQNDRTAAAASAGANTCDAFNIRNDLAFFNTTIGTNLYTNPGPTYGISANAQAAQGGEGYPLYVDPWGVVATGFPSVPVGGVIPRVIPSAIPAPYNTAAAMAPRYFSLPDDMTFYDSGAPDTGTPVGSTPIQRGGRYTWAYLLRPARAASPVPVDLTVVVYAARATSVPGGESTFGPPSTGMASGIVNDTSVILTWPGPTAPNIKRGGWILDTTKDFDPTTGVLLGVHGLFYRVVSVTQPSNNQMNLEIQVPLAKGINSITVLDNVADVFSRGAGDTSTTWEFRNEQ